MLEKEVYYPANSALSLDSSSIEYFFGDLSPKEQEWATNLCKFLKESGKMDMCLNEKEIQELMDRIGIQVANYSMFNNSNVFRRLLFVLGGMHPRNTMQDIITLISKLKVNTRRRCDACLNNGCSKATQDTANTQ